MIVLSSLRGNKVRELSLNISKHDSLGLQSHALNERLESVRQVLAILHSADDLVLMAQIEIDWFEEHIQKTEAYTVLLFKKFQDSRL